jgi:hypothetical protein
MVFGMSGLVMLSEASRWSVTRSPHVSANYEILPTLVILLKQNFSL